MDSKKLKLKKKSARELALMTLYNVETEEAYSNIELNKVLERYRPEKVDRSLITEIVYGSLRSLNTLDWVLSQFVKKPLASLTPWIRNILRLSLYQLMFMNKIPVSAAVNEGTELSKKYGHPGTVKFVNGVLRNISRQLDQLSYPSLEKEPVKHISIKYSHPEWMVEKWLKMFGLEGTIDLCVANNQTPPNVIRTNTLKVSRDDLIKRLSEEGVESEKTPFAPEGIVIKNFSSIGNLESFREGYFQPQDESSMLVAAVVAPQRNQSIIDACSAPGGKTTHLSQLMDNTGQVIAADVHRHKLGLIQDNAQRLGITNIKIVYQDARDLKDEYEASADGVLVDAPCSGLGVLRRRADARWRKEPAQIEELQQLQLEILESVCSCVKPGGILVYSTCSITTEENNEVINKFLSQNTDFNLDDLSPYLPEKLKSFSDLEPKKGYIQLLPHVHGTDGFFIARMLKKAGI